MKKIYVLAQVCIAFLVVSFTAFAQTESQLSNPSAISAGRTEGDIFGNSATPVNTIMYGGVPANAKPQVLVFIHGYTSSGTTWYENNDMYSKAYNAGYRTAFVTVNPDKNMWANGEMFKNMLNTITAKYGVSKVTVVCHSKGGIDTDAAAIHYGAYTKIDRVITLGTPHFGTPLADLAQSNWIYWLSYVFGQRNAATDCLQTGYMSYFRSVTDNHANRPFVNVRTIGGWGWGVLLSLPGAYLSFNGGGSSVGGNDGVVNYPSSKRPNSTTLLSGDGNPATRINHLELPKGSNMWQYVMPQINPSASIAVQSNNELSVNYNAVSNSGSQIVSSKGGSQNFSVENGAKAINIDIHHLDGNDKFNLIAPNGAQVAYKIENNSAAGRGDLFGKSSTTLSVENPISGNYTIVSENPFVAIVSAENGVSVSLSSDLNNEKWVYNAGETMNLKLNVVGNQVTNTQGATVTGVMTLTTDLMGNTVTRSKNIVLKFTESNGVYAVSVKENLPTGVYNIAINAENGNFRKTLITSIAVTDKTAKAQLENQLNKSIFESKATEKLGFGMLPNYPNPFNASTNIAFEIAQTDNYVLTIYDALGRNVKNYDLSAYEVGKHTISLESADLLSGMYIAEISNGKQKATQVMVCTK
jgi:pimeloyl-ACP methyl ester carboxylesterase